MAPFPRPEGSNVSGLQAELARHQIELDALRLFEPYIDPGFLNIGCAEVQNGIQSIQARSMHIEPIAHDMIHNLCECVKALNNQPSTIQIDEIPRIIQSCEANLSWFSEILNPETLLSVHNCISELKKMLERRNQRNCCAKLCAVM